MLKLSSIDDFKEALLLLDARLKEIDAKPIQIRAIGGFALMFHGLRGDKQTIDIDSLTKPFPQPVLDAVKRVGKELDLEEDWLNTDCATLQGFMRELAPKINWLDTDYPLQKIDLKVADPLGLARSKAKAVHDGGLVPRGTDKEDIIRILLSFGIEDIGALDANPDFAFIKESYPRCYAFLAEAGTW